MNTRLPQENKFQKSISTRHKLAYAIKESADVTIAQFVTQDKFCISDETGFIEIKKGALVTETDFFQALVGFSELYNMTKEFQNATAEREAQVALLAEKLYPKMWQDYCSGHPVGIDRIKKGMNVYKTLVAIGEKPFATMANMRKAIEVSVDNRNNNKNLKAKKEIVQAVVSFQEERGRQASQAEITDIKESIKARYKGIDHYVKPKQVYAFQRKDGSIFVVAGELNEEQLAKASLFSINLTDGMLLIVNEVGNVVSKRIALPTKKQQEEITTILELKNDAQEE